MIGFSISGRCAKFDAAGYLQKIEAHLHEARFAGIHAFVIALQQHVPLYEGTARGTIVPAARLVGEIVDTTPVRKPRAGRGGAIGEALATAKIFGNQYRLGFEWTNTLEHYAINENNNVTPPPYLIHPTPWLSIPAARMAYLNAFQDHVKSDLSAFQIKQHITQERI